MGHKHQVLMSLTRPLSKASPGAYRSYRMVNMCCLLSFYVMYCALYIGSYLMMVIGCMVVPFRILYLM
jgi:hypothetical protein